MATSKPSDADIFDDDDDEPTTPAPAKSGGSGGGKKPPTKPASFTTKKPQQAKKTPAPKKPVPPKPQKFKIGGKDVYDDLTYELKNRLVRAPKAERAKISAAMAAMSSPGISVAERLSLKKVIADANKELKKIEADNKSYIKNQQRFQAVQSDTGARLSALQDYMQKNNGKMSESEVRRLRAMEARLVRTIHSSDLSTEDHEQNEKVVKQLEKLEKLTTRLPDVLQKRFDEIDERTSVLITAQQQAAAMVAETNAKMKDFGKRMGMGFLDMLGVGPLTVGNAVRGAGKLYRGAKNAGGGVKSAAGYINAQRILRSGPKQDTTQVGSLIHAKEGPTAKPVPLPAPALPSQSTEVPPAEFDPDDPLTHPRKSKKGATLRSPTQNADKLDKMVDQVENMTSAFKVAQAGLESAAKLPEMEERLKAIRDRHDAEAMRPGKQKPAQAPRGKMGPKKAKDRFAAVMEARRASAKKQLPDAADVQTPVIPLRNKVDPDARGTFEAKTMRPLSVSEATRVDTSDSKPKDDPDARGTFKVEDGKLKSTKVVPLPVTSTPVSSQKEEDDRKSGDYQDDSLRESKRLNDILEAHAAAQSRFNDRLLGNLRGRAKPASKSNALGSVIGDLASSIGGLGKMLPGLMGLLGKGLAIGAAWQAGQYVGSKIYESQSENIGKGVDAVANFATRVTGGETNDDKIEKMLKGDKPNTSPSRTKMGAPRSVVPAKLPDTKATSAAAVPASSAAAAKPAQASAPASEKAPTPSSAASPILDDSASGTSTPVSLPPVSITGKREDTMSSPAGEEYPVAAGGQNSQYSKSSGGKDGSAGGRVKDFVGKLFSKSSGVNVEGLHPKMQNTLVQMGQEYFQATGKKLNFNSAFRSLEEQADLYRTKPPGMAGKPGSSLHNFGLAVDLPSAQANELDKLGLLGKYGFVRPIPNEKWHIQPAGISVAAAKAGIYSADAPVDQGQPRSQMASAKQQAPSVTAANYELPKNTNGKQSGSPGSSQSGGFGGTAGGTRVSASSIPTFDNTDGAFLALNTGII